MDEYEMIHGKVHPPDYLDTHGTINIGNIRTPTPKNSNTTIKDTLV